MQLARNASDVEVAIVEVEVEVAMFDGCVCVEVVMRDVCMVLN